MLKWRVVLLGAILVAKAQQGYPRIIGTENTTMINEADDLLNEEVDISSEKNQKQPETAARVFPDVRKTRFSCADYPHPGYYADLETECQIFHICQIGGRKDSFPCPKGTIFNQEKLVCDWWYNFECKKSREYYFINEVVASAMREVDQRLQYRTKKSEQIPIRDYKAVQSSREIELKDASQSMDEFFVRKEETTRDNEDLELVEESSTEMKLDLTQRENFSAE